MLIWERSLPICLSGCWKNTGELEELRPVEYAYFEENYGRLLENAAWFWSRNYPGIWVKIRVETGVREYYCLSTEGVR